MYVLVVTHSEDSHLLKGVMLFEGLGESEEVEGVDVYSVLEHMKKAIETRVRRNEMVNALDQGDDE